jgi:hypothetical protein
MAETLRKASRPARATALAALVILAGVLAVFVPYVVRDRTLSAGVPAPPALYASTEFALAPRRSACMSSVSVEPDSHLARFAARPAPSPPQGGAQTPMPAERPKSGWRPPVEISIAAHGYHASGIAPAGHGYKQLSVAIVSPKHAVLSTVCFLNRGHSGVALEGTTEARTVSRSPTSLAGVGVVGDIALAFAEAPRRSLLDGLGTIFARASRLAGGLVPVWLIWALALLVAVGVPLGVLGALYSALREDDARLDAPQAS